MGETLEIDGAILFETLAKFFGEITDNASKLVDKRMTNEDFKKDAIRLVDALQQEILLNSKRERRKPLEEKDKGKVEVDWS